MGCSVQCTGAPTLLRAGGELEKRPLHDSVERSEQHTHPNPHKNLSAAGFAAFPWECL